jgi:hypothetical protein
VNGFSGKDKFLSLKANLAFPTEISIREEGVLYIVNALPLIACPQHGA